MSRFALRLAIALISLGTAVSAASRVSGTYVAHGADFTEMLQLTQTDNGQITGVMSSIQLKPDGNISSDQTPLTGVVDGNQITLTGRSLLSFLSSRSVSGTVTGNAIHLQAVDSRGNVTSDSFVRSSAAEFGNYAEQLKGKSQGALLSTKLTNSARELRQADQNAEKWIANAELHAQRIPAAKDAYKKIEDRMSALVTRERSTPDSAERGRISLAVGQGDLAGGQVDLDVNQVWDYPIESVGTDVYKQFSGWDGKCGNPEDLRKQGATAQAITAWGDACNAAIAERAKFVPAFKHIMEQRQELKSFQASAETRRKRLVDESNKLE